MRKRSWQKTSPDTFGFFLFGGRFLELSVDFHCRVFFTCGGTYTLREIEAMYEKYVKVISPTNLSLRAIFQPLPLFYLPYARKFSIARS